MFPAALRLFVSLRHFVTAYLAAALIVSPSVLNFSRFNARLRGGAGDRSRTYNLLITSQLLYH